MSSLSEQQKYQKKYLKYKKKYLMLEEEMNGGGIWSAVKKGASSASSVAKKGVAIASSAVKNPEFQAVASAALTTAVAQPRVQEKLNQAQQYYSNSPNLQLATQIASQTAMSHPKVQSALANPTVQSAMSHPAVQQIKSQQAQARLGQNPDDIWKTLTLEQKQKLILLLS